MVALTGLANGEQFSFPGKMFGKTRLGVQIHQVKSVIQLLKEFPINLEENFRAAASHGQINIRAIVPIPSGKGSKKINRGASSLPENPAGFFNIVPV